MLRTLIARDRLLTFTAGVMVAGLILALIIAPFDTRMVTGINPWIKPMKFFASIAIFLATMAWFMPDLDAPPRTRRRLAIVFASTMLIEVACIAGQAARGTTSHFNYSTLLDGVIFQVMGIAITVNTVAVGVMLRRLRRDAPAERAGYLLGVRLGLALFVVGSLQGFVIIGNMGHSVPGPDGGPGLPFLNWALGRGDLRIAHFIGLHALQALPLLGYALDWMGTPAPATRRLAVTAVAALWFGVMGTTLGLAMGGQSLWAR